MKRVKVKISCMILSTMLMAGMLAGCKGKDSASSGDASKPSATPVELKVEVFDRGASGQLPVDNNYWTQYIQKNFGDPNNITLKYVSVPRGQEVDKLNIMMASNEVPDIVFTYNQGVVYNYVRQNGLAELGDLVDKYGPNIKKYLGDEVLSYGEFNGKLYSIPAKRTIVGSTTDFIRKDWLDKLGLPVPKTRDELYNTLKAFKEKNPGNVNGVIPMGLSGFVDWTAQNMINSFLGKMTEEEFATLPIWLKPGHKDAVKFLNKLYKEGLLSPEFAIDKDETKYNADAASGKMGFIVKNLDFPYRNNPGVAAALEKNVPGASFVPLNTFENYEGKYTREIYPLNGIYNLIPKSSKRSVEAIKYLDWLTKPEVVYFLQNGDEGTHHKLVDGIPQALKYDGDKKINTVQNIDYTLTYNGIELGDPAKNKKAWTMSYPGFESLAEKAFDISIEGGYTPFRFDRPIESSAKYEKVLIDKTREMYIKLIAANSSDFDKLYDQLVDDYMKAGGQQVMDEKKEAYKAMKK